MSGTELEIPTTMHVEDVPPSDEPTERQRNPRDVMMEAIAKRYEELTLAHELDLGAEMARDAQERDAGEAHEPQQQPARHAAPSQRTITLQGQVFQVTEEQHQRLAEMGALANLALQQPPQAPPTPQHVPQQYVQQAAHRQQYGTPLLGQDEARDIVQKLSYGSSEDGVEAVQSQIARNASAVALSRKLSGRACSHAV